MPFALDGWMDEDGGKSPKIEMFLEGNQLILISKYIYIYILSFYNMERRIKTEVEVYHICCVI